MIKLQFNKTTQCPKCNCNVVIKEEIELNYRNGSNTIRTHCNGGRWEKRTFLCGYATEYIPNFSRNEDKSSCTNDQEYIAKEKKKEDIKKKISELQNQLYKS